MTPEPIREESCCDRILTIAVCTYRRFPWLRDCIYSLENQTLEKTLYRILVVDNSLLGESLNVRESLRHIDNLEYIITEKSGISYARNVALERCDSPYLAFIDDDAIACPGWAEAIISSFENNKGSVGVVGGPVEPIWEKDRPDWLMGRLLNPLAVVDWGNERRVVNGFSEWFVAANVAYRTDILKRIKGFPQHLGRKGDLLLCHEELWVHRKFRELGYMLSYSPDVKVRHLIQKERISINWLCLDAFWEGISRRIVDYQIEDVSVLDQRFILKTKNKVAEMLNQNYVEEKTDEIIQATIRFNNEGKKIIDQLFGALQDKIIIDNKKQVFIVTPCKNAAESIDRTITSVASQKGDFSLHYHIQDAGSSDGTIQKLEKWKDLLDSGEFPVFCSQVSFSWASEPDNGMYDAICKGFSLYEIPKGAAMTWLNADDFLYQGAVANVVALFSQEDSVDWITGATDVHDESGKKIGFYSDGFPGKIIKEGLCDTQHWRVIQQEGTFWKKRLWDKVGGLDQRLKFAGDWDLWRRFANHAELYIFPWPAGSFQLREGQLSGREGVYIKEINMISPEESRHQSLHEIRQNLKNFEYMKVTPDYGSKVFRIEKKIANDTTQSGCEELIPKESETKHESQANGIDGTEMNQSKTTKPSSIDFPPDPRHHASHSFPGVLFHLPKLMYWWVSIQNSRLFYNSYYLYENPDVANSRLSPLMHYLLFGAAEGRNPNPLFDSQWYVERYPDVQESGINPFYHYMKYAWKEGRDPGPGFSTKDYLNEYTDVSRSKVNPLKHYLLHGIAEGREGCSAKRIDVQKKYGR